MVEQALSDFPVAFLREFDAQVAEVVFHDLDAVQEIEGERSPARSCGRMRIAETACRPVRSIRPR